MLYLDASALVKRYVAEEGSEAVRAAMSRADAWFMCRVGFVETARAVALAGGERASAEVWEEVSGFGVVEVDDALTRDAARLAVSDGLRSLDALHLASAMTLPAEDLTVATWDRRLYEAARTRGMDLLPLASG